MQIPIILNADDFGLSDGVCGAVADLLDVGAISGTTIMAAAPGALARLHTWLPALPSERIGVHLHLTTGRPLSPPEQVESLCDSDGWFLPSSLIEQRANPHQVYSEWKAQIKAVAAVLGRLPSHLDSHLGWHRRDPFTAVYLDLASEYGLPVRGGGHATNAMRARGVPGSTSGVPGWSGTGADLKTLQTLILEKRGQATTHTILDIACHPGRPNDAYLRTVSDLADARINDYNCLLELHRTGWLERIGMPQTSYSELWGQGATND